LSTVTRSSAATYPRTRRFSLLSSCNYRVEHFTLLLDRDIPSNTASLPNSPIRWDPGCTAKQGFNIKNRVRYEISRRQVDPKLQSPRARARLCSGLEHCCSRVLRISFNKSTFAAERDIGSGIDACRRYRECVPLAKCHVLEAQEAGRARGKLGLSCSK
jgi:hypothetical protein